MVVKKISSNVVKNYEIRCEHPFENCILRAYGYRIIIYL